MATRTDLSGRIDNPQTSVVDVVVNLVRNAFFQAIAREWPRGYFPRGFSGEQPCWTIVGIDAGSETGLLSEDGALEVARIHGGANLAGARLQALRAGVRERYEQDQNSKRQSRHHDLSNQPKK